MDNTRNKIVNQKKFHGTLVYKITKESSNGSFVEVEKRKSYLGDIIIFNKNYSVDNKISIVADAFAFNNIESLKSIEWRGEKWEVTDVSVQKPRLLISFVKENSRRQSPIEQKVKKDDEDVGDKKTYAPDKPGDNSGE